MMDSGGGYRGWADKMTKNGKFIPFSRNYDHLWDLETDSKLRLTNSINKKSVLYDDFC